jgi:predicted DNA-binding transcriptional regulator YafY
VRASRLLSILLLLQARGRMTAAELATELEVSLRTVYRDADALAAAGVPIYADRGPAGGYQLLDGYRTRLTGLTSDEASSIFLAGIPGPAAELGLGTILATAQLKLLAALPAELRTRAGRIRERFLLDAPGWFQAVDETPHLATIAAAVWQQQRIQVDYRGPRGESTRTLDPLGVVLKSGIWYLVAVRDGQARTYRVSRVRGLRALDEHVDRPAGFDLSAYWADSIAAYRRDLPRVTVEVRVRPDSLPTLATLLGSSAVEDGERLAVPDDPDGWAHLRLRVDWPEDAAARLVGMGGDLEVLAPAAIRDQVLALARGAAARHSPAGRPVQDGQQAAGDAYRPR